MNVVLIITQLIQFIDVTVDSYIDDILLKQMIVTMKNEKKIITNV